MIFFHSCQYGFRQGHSAEYAALELVYKITQYLDQNRTPINFYLDVSKAFDTLDHSILTQKLKFYGIEGAALNLFQSYLSNRLQFVEYDNIMSDPLEISTGVPLGSVLGPLLFLIFINDIDKSSDSFGFICYADDTTLSSIMNYFSSTEQSNENSINDELSKVNDWLKINKLSINIYKTKFMIFHNYQQQITMPNIFIDNVAIECVPNFNFLGIHFNQHLSWKPHITHISNLITKFVGVLNRLKNILPTSIKLMIYNALILSRINYGISAWGYQCERIFKLQKRAVRLITLAKFNAHSEPIFKSLNLLKVQDVFEICQMRFYHNYLNKNLPHFFNQMIFQNNNQIHRYETRINSQFHLPKIKHSFAK